MSYEVKISSSLIEELCITANNDNIEKIVVGAVAKFSDMVLLLRRAKNDFMGGLIELPSGTVDLGEPLCDALVREVYEETGLTVTCILSYIGYFDYKSGSGKDTRQFNFLVSTDSNNVVIDPKEHDDFFWVKETQELDRLSISPETRKTLESYL